MKLRYVAIDFDGTITEPAEYPAIGELRPMAKKTIEHLKEKGLVLVLWTCRTGNDLRDALEFLENHDITFDYVNENPKELQDVYKNDPRKLGVDVFIDDKNFAITQSEIDWQLIKFNSDINWEVLSLDEYKQR